MMIEYNIDDLIKLRDNLQNFTVELDHIMRAILQEVALRALARVKELTPVDEGLLRQSWMLTHFQKKGHTYEVTLENNTEYASFVEYGHSQEVGRYVPALGKRLKEPWVFGKFMLTITMDEMEKEIDRMAEKILEEKLREVFDG